MALFQKVTIVDSRGKEHIVEAGPFSRLEVKQGEHALCVDKEDVLGIKKETTCLQQAPVAVVASR